MDASELERRSLNDPDVDRVLARAARLIESESAWTQRAMARRDDDTQLLDPEDDAATKWCATGAVARAAHELTVHDRVMELAVERLLTQVCNGVESQACTCSVECFNDDDATSHEDVALLFKRALTDG